MISNVLAVLLLLLPALAAGRAEPGAVQGTATLVYAGALNTTWRDASVGCWKCIEQDERYGYQRIAGNQTFFAAVLARGSVIWEAGARFSGQQILDFWAHGSGISRSSVSLYNDCTDGVSFRSQKISMANLNAANPGAIKIAGFNSWGWLHIQINLARLTTDANAAIDIALPNEWTSIHFDDVSGTGFEMSFDSVYLWPVDATFSAASAESVVPIAVPAQPVIATSGNTSKSKYIIKFAADATAADVDAFCAALKDTTSACTALPTAPGAVAASVANETEALTLDVGGPVLLVPLTLSSNTTLQMIQDLGGSKLSFMEEDETVSIVLPASIEAATSTWGIDRLDQPDLPLDGDFSPNKDGTGVHIFILDTGIRATHSDFKGRVQEGVSFVGGDYNQDFHGHGTFCAGVAAGKKHGVASQAVLHAVQVLYSDGTGPFSAIAAGMDWVRNFVKSKGISKAVASISIGGPRSPLLNEAAQKLVDAGVVVLTSAGNDYRADACSYSPASLNQVITVGATDIQDRVASYSNVGGCLTVFAPGTGILSAGSDGDTAEKTLSGTSMACPHVAGIAALILQSSDNATPACVTAVVQNASLIRSLDSSSPGLLANIQQLKAAVQTAQKAGKCGSGVSSASGGISEPAPPPAPVPGIELPTCENDGGTCLVCVPGLDCYAS